MHWRIVSRKAFTLVEVMVVLIIISVLIGITVPVVAGAKKRAKNAEARHNCIQLVGAIDMFFGEYHRYPTLGKNGQGVSDAHFIDHLTGVDGSINTNGRKFFQTKISKSGRGGLVFTGSPKKDSHELRDPWGNYYQIRIDTDYDEKVNNPYPNGADSLPKGVIVWSGGADGSSFPPDHEDNIESWD